MAAAGAVAAQDRDAPDAAVFRMDCIDPAGYGAGGLGAAGAAGPDVEGPAAEGDAAHDPEPGDGAGWVAAGAAGDLRHAEPDADDPGIGYGWIDGGVSGLHPGVLWVVCV